MNVAVEPATEELSKLSARRRVVLEAVACGRRSWSQVSRLVANKHGVVVLKSPLTRITNKLEEISVN
ncbi:MAG: hypothetical protein ACO2OR_07415 [Desulfurococcaceae archaeon]